MENLANNNSLLNSLPEERGWEYKQITITRVPGYGFGIAVSGGRDNPHFASGDPSIAVSDVLASGPAERLLQVNDRIISVNGISLQNVDYATAVQVLRDSGDTVILVVKRRIVQHSHSASFPGTPLAALGINPLPPKVTLTKNSKKEDFGIVLGCKLFIKEISAKAREQLLNTNQMLSEGDFIVKLNNTNCNDLMSLKEAKKIIDGTKDKLHITVNRDLSSNQNAIHQIQGSLSTTGDDFLTSGQSYSNQNLYVQPPTRNPNLNNGFDDKMDLPSGPNSLNEDKSNLAPRGRLRGPLSQDNLNQLDRNSYGRSKGRDEPPRPPPPRPEDYYSRGRLYDEDPIILKTKQQPIPDARFITFHKEGSVGIRLTGGNFVGIFVTAVQPGSPASLQGLQPGDKILKVNDMDMSGVTREEAVLFLLSLQDRIELIVQYCKEEYDSIVASQKGDSFYIKTHFHYENPAKGELSFKSGDIFHVIDTLYNGVVGCWQVYRIGPNNQEIQKGIVPNKSRAEELATAQFNATKKEMSANESRGNFFRRRRSSNRRSKSLGKEHWDDILFSDTVSKFPAYERVVLKHPGFTRPVILFGPIADVARDKLLKDFPDKFISPQLDNNTEEKTKSGSNIIRLSAIREVISTGKHALLDITPNAVERLNYAQLYPIVVFFKADAKIVIKQLRQGLPKSAHKSSKKLLEQCQKLDKVWSHIFCSTVTLNDNSDTWYRKIREIIDKQQTGAVWMSETKLNYDMFTDIYFPFLTLKPRARSLPAHYRGSRSLKTRRINPCVSMYSPSECPIHLQSIDSQSRLSLNSAPYHHQYHYQHDPNPYYNHNQSYPEESLSDDFLFPMSSLRLSYASSPESDLEHSPGPPVSPGLSGTGSNNGRLTKASSDPSVVMPDSSTNDVLPPYQPTYDTRYGFNNQNSSEPQSPSSTAKDINYIQQSDSQEMLSGDLTGYKGHYPGQDYNKNDGAAHKRQSSTLHGHFNHSKTLSMSEQPISPTGREGIYGTAPDLPPRVDRAVKPLGLISTPTKSNGPSAHERLFGTKPPDQNPDHNFANKLGSLERSQNSKSDSLSSYDSFNNQNSKSLGSRIIPNAHDDLKTTLSKIEPSSNSPNIQNSPSKYAHQRSWGDQNHHRHDRLGSKLDLKYAVPPSNNELMDQSPRHSRGDVEKEPPPPGLEHVHQRLPPERNEMYRYARSPGKQQLTPSKQPHMETKTDYGKYNQDYSRASQQDLSQSHLSIHQSPQQQHLHHHGGGQMMRNGGGMENGNNHMNQNGPNMYKPIPPPKPKNYKPPYKNQSYGPGDGMMQPPLPYQHGKSHSNPVDQRANLHQEYYYNMPQNNVLQNNWHTETAVRYNTNVHGHYDVAPPYERRHPSISYASRSEIAPISQHDPYMDGNEMMDTRPERPNIVDLQGSREQRGSAFELYRKPLHHNLSSRLEDTKSSLFGSQPNITHLLESHHQHSSPTNTNKTKKLSKTQSFKHQKGGETTPKFFKKFSFRNKTKETTPKMGKKLLHLPDRIPEDRVEEKRNENKNYLDMNWIYANNNSKDVTYAVVDCKGGVLINEYWGVKLEIPEAAIKAGVEQEIYFVITDPRLCENSPPLDLENGETMLSPLVMCGPQGIEFNKPVILHIPHYANTLPSLSISLKATDSESDVRTDWDNILLPSNHAANSVAVKVDHF
ncbi:tight junction protein ZO-1 isoform X3 [Onthophagus taurus]|uniref:tight junction protein ZO-1 isoform X3 n=1 Tax=Onthophagus taurus TaxID=166361 RepID=UPI0039BE7DD0